MPISKNTDPSFKTISIKPIHVPNAETLYFSSIVTEFSDTWSPRWSATNVYGRMDPVSFYSGTGRELTLGFRVISDNKTEAAENMRKIQKLLQYQYPYYANHGSTGVKILTAPPYFKVRFMNVASDGAVGDLRGYINGAVQINPGFQSKQQSQYFSEDNERIYFSDVNIVLKFQVLHENGIGFMQNGFNRGDKYPYMTEGSPPAQPVDENNEANGSNSAGSPASPGDAAANATTNSANPAAAVGAAAAVTPSVAPADGAERRSAESAEAVGRRARELGEFEVRGSGGSFRRSHVGNAGDIVNEALPSGPPPDVKSTPASFCDTTSPELTKQHEGCND